jgi:hypothetical protein
LPTIGALLLSRHSAVRAETDAALMGIATMKRRVFAKELRARAAALRAIIAGQDAEDDQTIARELSRVADDLEQRAGRFETVTA